MSLRFLLAITGILAVCLSATSSAKAEQSLSQSSARQQCEHLLKERYPNRHLTTPIDVNFLRDDQVTTLMLTYQAPHRGHMQFACHFSSRNGTLMQIDDMP